MDAEVWLKLNNYFIYLKVIVVFLYLKYFFTN